MSVVHLSPEALTRQETLHGHIQSYRAGFFKYSSSSNHNVTPIIVTARLVIGRAQPADFRQALMSINADESP
jgi:hypothetical protein